MGEQAILYYNMLGDKWKQYIGNWSWSGCFDLCSQDPAELGEVCPDPSGNIAQYQISFQTGSFVNSENVNIVMCAAGRCSHSYELTSNLLNGSVISSIETVSVAAENVVGLGATRTCAAHPISELAQDAQHFSPLHGLEQLYNQVVTA